MTSKIMFLAVSVIIVIASCKKDDDQTTNSKVMGKWSIETTQTNNVVGGASTVNTYTGIPSDYVEFRTDNKVYSSVNGGLDTTNYSISNNQVTINKNTAGSVAQTYDIKILTNTQLKLYTKNVVSATDYGELTINLKK